jgi:16S rRNA (guanine527-N7)-methyltransferase
MIQQLSEPDPAYVIAEGSRLLGLRLDPGALEAMLKYINLVLEWRKRARLTALGDPTRIAIFHFLDSLAVFKVLPQHQGFNVLDIGTGAGFPGLVMSIADPTLEVTLMDRDARKIVFLKYAVKQLGLPKVRFLNAALQDLFAAPASLYFEVIVSRAFSSDPALMDKFASVLLPGGSLIRMAGPASVKTEFSLDSFFQEDLWEGTLPFSDRFRRVLRYRKKR